MKILFAVALILSSLTCICQCKVTSKKIGEGSEYLDVRVSSNPDPNKLTVNFSGGLTTITKQLVLTRVRISDGNKEEYSKYFSDQTSRTDSYTIDQLWDQVGFNFWYASPILLGAYLQKDE
jgi:hypothetical protein